MTSARTEDARPPAGARSTTPHPVVLCVLGGVGMRDSAEGNAVAKASTPVLDGLRRRGLATSLAAAGPTVNGHRFGDDESGALVIGAGRPVPTLRARIDESIRTHQLSREPLVERAARMCMYDGCAMHLIGLISDGSCHASTSHLLALVDLFEFHGIKVVVHAVVDGRESAPKGGLEQLDRLQLQLEGKQAVIGTVAGRRYAMDADGRWERVYQAYHAIVRDKVLGPAAPQASSVFELMSNAYANGLSDAFIEPTRIGDYHGISGDFVCEFGSESAPVWAWTGMDCGMTFHCRGDGLRQLAQMLTRQGLPDDVAKDLLMDRHHPVLAFREHCFMGLTSFGDDVALPAAFAREPLASTLGETLARAGKKQLRCAESERLAHATRFFAGGRVAPFDGEAREIVPSPRLVDSYADKPEMSAAKLADKACAAIAAHQHDFILVHFANPDLVAQTAHFDATVAALEAVAPALAAGREATLAAGGGPLLTSDHGSCEAMLDAAGRTSGHATDSPVPLIYASDARGNVSLRSGGDLADVAPTVLDLMGVAQPPEMTGRTLLVPR